MIAGKAGPPTMAAVSGTSRPFAKAVTSVRKAAPMTTAAAKSSTLHRSERSPVLLAQDPTFHLTMTGRCWTQNARYYRKFLPESHLKRRLFGSAVRRIAALRLLAG